MKDYLLRSSDRYNLPDSLYGFGIPDFSLMMQALNSPPETHLKNIKIYPNPFSHYFYVKNLMKPLPFKLYNTTGQIIRTGNLTNIQHLENLTNGIYFLIIDDHHYRHTFKLIKQ